MGVFSFLAGTLKQTGISSSKVNKFNWFNGDAQQVPTCNSLKLDFTFNLLNKMLSPTIINRVNKQYNMGTHNNNNKSYPSL